MNKNKIIITILSIFCVMAVHFFQQPYIDYRVSVNPNNPTVKEIYTKLNIYLKEKGTPLRPSSLAYLEYLTNLLTFENNGTLKQLPEYDAIKVYASNYLSSQKEYLSDSIINLLRLYNPIPASIENKTINELKQNASN